MKVFGLHKLFTFSDVQTEVTGYGKVKVDISYGGGFYAILSAESLGLDVRSSPAQELISAATALKRLYFVIETVIIKIA